MSQGWRCRQVRPVTTGRRRLPQDTISGNILGISTVRANLVHELTTMCMKAKYRVTYKCEMRQRALPLDTAAGHHCGTPQ